MRVIALVGGSGSGKSHNALQVACENGIDLIVDDGLLIDGGKKLGGRSAKGEKTRIAAVKRALFSSDDHRDEIAGLLRERDGSSLMIIGTSDKMVGMIAERLGAGPIERTIRIGDVSTPEEISAARYFRKKHGKHVIPLPQMEIRKDFSGYVRDTIRSLLRKNIGSDSGEEDTARLMDEKTVIRPTFSYLGNYTISNRTVSQIVKAVGMESKGIHSVSRVAVTVGEDGIDLDIQVCASCTSYGVGMIRFVETFQKRVISVVEGMTMLNVATANVHVKNVRF
jgi:uncharacterized alkaline shock family protein YloU